MATPDAGTLTVIIHGTFAANEGWWRLGASDVTFADRLERAMAHCGTAGSVWRPALDVGMGYDAFRWSGHNRHADRLAGARQLRRALAEAAHRLGASTTEPLQLNIVAHSHGGNVVLEALRGLPRSIRLGRVAFLGTPLLAWRPGLRVLRLLLGIGLFGAVGALLLGTALSLAGIQSAPGFSVPVLLGIALLGVLSYGWVFWLAGAIAETMWWPFGWLWLAMAGRAAGQAYGAGPAQLATRLGDRPIVLFSSHEDEADLALQLGAAPRRVYEEWIGERRPSVRVLELLLARPFVTAVLMPAMSLLLEHYLLGFEWWRGLVANAEMADLDGGRSYPDRVVRREDVTEYLVPLLEAARAEAPVIPVLPVPGVGQLRGAARRAASLKETLVRVGSGLITNCGCGTACTTRVRQ